MVGFNDELLPPKIVVKPKYTMNNSKTLTFNGTILGLTRQEFLAGVGDRMWVPEVILK